MFATPCLFMLVGFTHTFSWQHYGDSDEDRFSLKHFRDFYVNRLLRFWPMVFVTFLFAYNFIPMFGDGPVWSFYDTKVMAGCNKYWWTNFVYVNNIIPTGASYDDKCMPWTWFIPALVQVSLLLPFIMLCYSKLMALGLNYVRFFFATLFIAMWTFTYWVTYTRDVGSVPITIVPNKAGTNDENEVFRIDFRFYNEIYMQPWYWISFYLVGVAFSCFYCEYLRQQKDGAFEGPGIFLNKLANSLLVRACIYAVIAFFMVFAIIRQRAMVQKADEQPLWDHALWATFGDFGFTLGFALLLDILIVGKCRPLLYVLEGDFWTAPSKFIAMVLYINPTISQLYLMSASTQLNYKPITQLEYFLGNLVFSVTVGSFIGVISDFPVQCLKQMPYR